MASIAAGETRGVAPDATINSIRVTYNCEVNAYTSDVIEAFEWIIDNGEPNSIINLSMSAPTLSMTFAMNNTIMDGHVIVSSAGNNGMNACVDAASKYKQNSSIMVAASSDLDAQVNNLIIPFKNGATWSTNFGPCVDVYAPGHNIYAAKYNSSNTFITESGTSMASPFVAGIAAGYRSAHPNSSPQEVVQAIVNSSSSGKLSGLGAGSPNKLAYNILTTPSVYWKKTGQITLSQLYKPYEPFDACTAGQQRIQVTEPMNNWSLYTGHIWECK